MQRGAVTFLRAATALAGVSGVVVASSGCAGHANHSAMVTIAPPTMTAQPAEQGPLPAPQALTEVIYRIADPTVPGAAKLPLVQNSAPSDAGAFDRFTAALRDTGFMPITVSATDLRWSPAHAGDPLATVKIAGGGKQNNGDFAFPMEFHRSATSTGAPEWQLTRETAEMLMAFGNARAAVASAPP